MIALTSTVPPFGITTTARAADAVITAVRVRRFDVPAAIRTKPQSRYQGCTTGLSATTATNPSPSEAMNPRRSMWASSSSTITIAATPPAPRNTAIAVSMVEVSPTPNTCASAPTASPSSVVPDSQLRTVPGVLSALIQP